MNPTCNQEHQQGAYHRCNQNRPELRLDNIEIKHQGHPGRHEEEAEIGDQEIGQASATYLPDLKENAEIIHSSEVKDAFLSFSADVNHQYTSGYVSASSNVFSLGGGDIILSPSKSSGTVKVETVSLGTVAVEGTSYQLPW